MKTYAPEFFYHIAEPTNMASIRQLGLLSTEQLMKQVGMSKPELDIVIVDATTRPGMSGAPVFVRLLTMTGAPFQARLVGIYTGRVGMKNGDSALGKVFKPRVINETAESGLRYLIP